MEADDINRSPGIHYDIMKCGWALTALNSMTRHLTFTPSFIWPTNQFITPSLNPIDFQLHNKNNAVVQWCLDQHMKILFKKHYVIYVANTATPITEKEKSKAS